VIGKAFWDVGHAPKDQSNRRKYMPATRDRIVMAAPWHHGYLSDHMHSDAITDGLVGGRKTGRSDDCRD